MRDISQPITYPRGTLPRMLGVESVDDSLLEKILSTNIGDSFNLEEKVVKITPVLKQQALKYKNPLMR
jgi:hypothetical protein